MEINATVVKDPSSIQLRIIKISKKERTASGKMAIDVIATKRELVMTYDIIAQLELKAILDELEAASFATVEYPDADSGETAHIVVCADSYDMTIGRKVDGSRLYLGVKFTLEER